MSKSETGGFAKTKKIGKTNQAHINWPKNKQADLQKLKKWQKNQAPKKLAKSQTGKLAKTKKIGSANQAPRKLANIDPIVAKSLQIHFLPKLIGWK